MNYKQQRALALQHLGQFPEVRAALEKKRACFPAIIKAALPYRGQILKLWRNDWPKEWLYYWALYAGDKEVMLRRLLDGAVTQPGACCPDAAVQSALAINWALRIGDKEVVRALVVDPYWAGVWVNQFGDKAYMQARFPRMWAEPADS